MSTVAGFLVGQHGKLSGLRVAIPPAGLVIGRDPKHADVVLEDTLVSRRHAQLGVDKNGHVFIVDLQSRNGTFVNGRKLTAPVALSPGDNVAFGGENAAIFIFESAATPSVTGVLKQAFGEHFAPVEWKPGDVILDTYEVLDVLGQGGMGKVYKVHHKGWNMDLAVKSPLPGLFNEEKSVENFIREAETWMNLNLHPNIVQCFYVRTIGDIPRIFAEYVPGGTLASWIKNRKLTTLDQILDVAIQFAWGLHAAHEQGIVHQDVKPLNVLMTPDGIVKVTDFGLARSRPFTKDNTITTPDNMVTMAGVFTTAYCSPEQARGEKLSRKTDIWSWAVSVLEMFTGGIVWQNGLQAPAVLKAYRSLLGPKFIVKMPKDLAGLIEHCLSTAPTGRPEDMREVIETLLNLFYAMAGKPYQRYEPRATEHLSDSLNNHAVSLIDLGRTQEAMHLWEQGIQAQPHHPESTYNRVLIAKRLGRISDREARRLMIEVVRSHRKEWLSCCLFASLLLEQGAWSYADWVLGWIHQDPPDEAKELRRIAQNFAIRQGFTASLRLCRVRDSAEHFGSDVAYHTALDKAKCAIAEHRYKLAAHFLREARHQTGCERRRDAVDAWDSLYTHLPRVALRGGWQCGTLAGVQRSIRPLVRVSQDGHYGLIAAKLNPEDGASGEFFGVEMWEISSGRRVRALFGRASQVIDVDVTPNWSLAATVEAEGIVKLWDIQEGRCLGTLGGQQGKAAYFRMIPNTDFGVAGLCDGTMSLWSLTGRPLHRKRIANANTNCACLTPDNRGILAGGDDGKLQLYDIATGSLVRVCQCTTEVGRAVPVGVTMDNRYALAAYSDQRVRVWDISSARCIWDFMGETAFLGYGGRYLLTGALGSVFLLDISRKKSLRTFDGHEGTITSLAMSADHRLFISAGEDGTVRVWNLDWELDENEEIDWHENATAYLKIFLTLQTPSASDLLKGRVPVEKEIMAVLMRSGKPVWSDADFQRLLYELGCAGYGWLRPDRVRQELEKMAVNWPSLDQPSGGSHP